MIGRDGARPSRGGATGETLVAPARPYGGRRWNAAPTGGGTRSCASAEISWREGVYSNAYYFVDVVTERGPAPIYFTGDRESRLGNPVVVARAFETNRVPLLIGVDYSVTSDTPFTVSFPVDYMYPEVETNEPRRPYRRRNRRALTAVRVLPRGGRPARPAAALSLLTALKIPCYNAYENKAKNVSMEIVVWMLYLQ